MTSKFPLINILVLIAVSIGLYFYCQTNELLDFIPLLVGNVAMFIITMVSYSMIAKSLKVENPNALMRAKTAGTMLKFFSVISLVLAYIFLFDRELKHKPNIYTFVVVYIVYMLIESIFLSRMAHKEHPKPKKN